MNEEYIASLLEAQNVLLSNILEVLSSGIHVKREGSNKYPAHTPLSQDDMDSLDEEIDLDWWYNTYQTEPHPAKYMNRSGTPLSKQEMDYMFRRLLDISSVKPEVEGHEFQMIGKRYCKTEKNTFNCFAFVPSSSVT
jgi:hypothetical protein